MPRAKQRDRSCDASVRRSGVPPPYATNSPSQRRVQPASPAAGFDSGLRRHMSTRDWSHASGSAFSGGVATSRAALLGNRQQQQQMLRDEDDDVEAELDSMHDRVLRLKRVVGAIDEEAKERNKLLDDLQSTVHKAQAAVKETVRVIQKKYREGGGSGYLIVTVLFALAMFFLMYAIMKFRRIVRMFLWFL